MVATFIKGRIGNQMFQYAFSKAVKLAQGCEAPLVFDFSIVHKMGIPKDGFEDSLQYFKVEEYKTDTGLIRKYTSCYQKLLFLLYMIDRKFGFIIKKKGSWFALFRNHGLLYGIRHGYNSQYFYPVYQKYLKGKKNERIICNDFFQTPSAFDHIKPLLIEEFTPKLPPKPENKSLYDIINSTNSVCVSVRCGDYWSERFRDKFYVCDKHYFNAAIEKAKEMVQNPVFIFFSDDIGWVKSNLSVDSPSYYQSEEDPVWERLRLMYSCKHFIISNSTFSWWAQYLSRNKDNKIVISPDHWLNIKTDFSSPLISDEFIKIPCDYH